MKGCHAVCLATAVVFSRNILAILHATDNQHSRVTVRRGNVFSACPYMRAHRKRRGYCSTTTIDGYSFMCMIVLLKGVHYQPEATAHEQEEKD